jgi:hypothetical protein
VGHFHCDAYSLRACYSHTSTKATVVPITIFKQGSSDETPVAQTLERFPEEFKVINDLTMPFGNLDHVVVGLTGVFLLDTKNWRGVDSPGNQGELLCNGKPTDKPFVRQFVGRIMGIKERGKALAPGLDPYFQAVNGVRARTGRTWGCKCC